MFFPFCAVWNRIRPTLEPIVEARKIRRQETERKGLLETRTSLVENLYKTYLKTLKPSQWFFQPCPAEVCEFSPFNEHINAASDLSVKEKTFAAAMTMLPGLLVMWAEERRKGLLEMLRAASPKGAAGVLQISMPQSIGRYRRGRMGN